MLIRNKIVSFRLKKYNRKDRIYSGQTEGETRRQTPVTHNTHSKDTRLPRTIHFPIPLPRTDSHPHQTKLSGPDTKEKTLNQFPEFGPKQGDPAQKRAPNLRSESELRKGAKYLLTGFLTIVKTTGDDSRSL